MRIAARLVILLATAFLLAGCHRPATDVKPAAPGPAQRSFAARGLVREVVAERGKLVVRHEEIPGYMPKMTMELTVRNTNELSTVKAGDEITFQLVVTETEHWIEHIQRIGSSTETASPSKPTVQDPAQELKVGDLLPDAEFLDEDGQVIRFSQYRGKVLAFTFIFTRCPLPDFCPRMGQQFKQARQLLLADRSAPDKWQLLSISFDPDHDRPEVLHAYARGYRGDNGDRWRFASASHTTLARLAPSLDLRISRESGSISHNLRTVVLDGQGRVFRQFDGNTWTAAELAAAVMKAATMETTH